MKATLSIISVAGSKTFSMRFLFVWIDPFPSNYTSIIHIHNHCYSFGFPKGEKKRGEGADFWACTEDLSKLFDVPNVLYPRRNTIELTASPFLFGFLFSISYPTHRYFPEATNRTIVGRRRLTVWCFQVFQFDLPKTASTISRKTTQLFNLYLAIFIALIFYRIQSHHIHQLQLIKSFKTRKVPKEQHSPSLFFFLACLLLLLPFPSESSSRSIPFLSFPDESTSSDPFHFFHSKLEQSQSYHYFFCCRFSYRKTYSLSQQHRFLGLKRWWKCQWE